MIGVDTNVLLRLVIDDDPEQNRQAKHFFAARSADDPAFVSILALSEFIWVLQKRYGYAKEQLPDLLDALLASPDLTVERAGLVRDAAELFRQPHIGFADALIAGLAMDAGCTSVVTFDKAAAKRIAGMESLS